MHCTKNCSLTESGKLILVTGCICCMMSVGFADGICPEESKESVRNIELACWSNSTVWTQVSCVLLHG